MLSGYFIAHALGAFIGGVLWSVVLGSFFGLCMRPFIKARQTRQVATYPLTLIAFSALWYSSQADGSMPGGIWTFIPYLAGFAVVIFTQQRRRTHPPAQG